VRLTLPADGKSHSLGNADDHEHDAGGDDEAGIEVLFASVMEAWARVPPPSLPQCEEFTTYLRERLWVQRGASSTTA
jgi:hypothetical protein